MSPASRPSPPATEIGDEPVCWAARGWYLAVDYPVLASSPAFSRALERLRDLGEFKELLDEDGSIVHRNLFFEGDLSNAWSALAVLSPWSRRLTLTLKGHTVPYGLVRDVLWCAAFEGGERDCEVQLEAARWTLGCDNSLELGPRDFESRSERRRHLVSFASLDAQGCVCFNHAAIRAHLASSRQWSICPAAPQAFLDSFLELLPEALLPAQLGWAVALEIDDQLRADLGDALSAEHEFDLRPRLDVPTLGEPLILEPAPRRQAIPQAALRVSTRDGEVISERVRGSDRLHEVVCSQKLRLHALVAGGSYRRVRFLLTPAIRLGRGEPLPASRRGYRLRLLAQPTRAYGQLIRGLVQQAGETSSGCVEEG